MFTLEPLEPFNLEPLSVLLGPLRERFQCKRAEPNGTVPKENGYVMRDDSFVCFIISRVKYRRKLDFCDCSILSSANRVIESTVEQSKV